MKKGSQMSPEHKQKALASLARARQTRKANLATEKQSTGEGLKLTVEAGQPFDAAATAQIEKATEAWKPGEPEADSQTALEGMPPVLTAEQIADNYMLVSVGSNSVSAFLAKWIKIEEAEIPLEDCERLGHLWQDKLPPMSPMMTAIIGTAIILAPRAGMVIGVLNERKAKAARKPGDIEAIAASESATKPSEKFSTGDRQPIPLSGKPVG